MKALTEQNSKGCFRQKENEPGRRADMQEETVSKKVGNATERTSPSLARIVMFNVQD